MLTIAAEAQISKKDRLLSIKVAESVPSGDYDVLVVLMPKQRQPRTKKKATHKPKTIWHPSYQVPVNPSQTFSRTEIYGEDGR
jgi:hypothetical protein